MSKPEFQVGDVILIRRAKHIPFGGRKGEITGVFKRPNGTWAYWVHLAHQNTNNPTEREFNEGEFWLHPSFDRAPVNTAKDVS